MKNLNILCVAIFGLILASCNSTGSLDRSQAPAPAAAPTIQIPEYQNFTLMNGLQVIVVENHKLPSVSYQLSTDFDVVVEGDKAGAAQMAGELLRKGTTTRSKAEIDEAVDFMGASMNTSMSGIFARSLKKHSTSLLELMKDVLMNPTFPTSELEKAKTQTLSGLASAKTEPGSMMSNVKGIVNFGKDHPYGEVVTEKTVENITQADLKKFYSDYWKPNHSYLVIVGDVTLEEAKANANKYFGEWKKGDVPNPKFKSHQSPSGNNVVFVPLKGAVQSTINVTYPVDLKPGSNDALAARVMNSILGGGVFSGRLMQNLREDKGYTYGSRSSLSSDRIVGTFNAGASVRNEVTDSSVTEILYELKRMTTEPVTDSVLTFVKNSMSGSFARSLESPRTVARFALNTFKYNLPKDYYNTYLKRLEALTTEDVMNAAKKYIQPNNCNIIVVGNMDEAEKLAKFSSASKVNLVDQYGEEWQDLEAAPEGVTAQTVLDAYAAAVGGKEKIDEIITFQQLGSVSMMGQNFPVDIKMEVGKKFRMVIGSGQMILQDVYLSEGVGTIVGMGAPKADLDAEQINEYLAQSYPFAELEYMNLGYSITLDGISELNDKRVYVMTVTDANGKVSTEYYDIDSGLKVQTETLNSHPQMGEYTSTTKVVSYMEVDGIKFPSEFIQSEGGMESTITTSDIKINPNIPTFK